MSSVRRATLHLEHPGTLTSTLAYCPTRLFVRMYINGRPLPLWLTSLHIDNLYKSTSLPDQTISANIKPSFTGQSSYATAGNCDSATQHPSASSTNGPSQRSPRSRTIWPLTEKVPSPFKDQLSRSLSYRKFKRFKPAAHGLKCQGE